MDKQKKEEKGDNPFNSSKLVKKNSWHLFGRIYVWRIWMEDIQECAHISVTGALKYVRNE